MQRKKIIEGKRNAIANTHTATATFFLLTATSDVDQWSKNGTNMKTVIRYMKREGTTTSKTWRIG